MTKQYYWHRFTTIIILFGISLLFPMISNSEEQGYTIDLQFTEEYAEIGQPFPIEYTVSGGSGTYTDLRFHVVLCTGSRMVYDDLVGYVDSSEGIWDMTAPVGKFAIVYFSGKDAVTGELFSCEANNHIPIRPNPDYPVLISFDKSEYSAGDSINVQFNITGLYENLADGKIRWTIRRSDPSVNEEMARYDDQEHETAISASGTYSFTPQYGTGVFFTVEGTTLQGDPVYAESEVIPVSGFVASEYSIEFNFLEEYAEIGQPFPIEYSVSGGSGSYTEMGFDIVLCTGASRVYYYLNEKVNSKSGIWNMRAPVGTKGIVYFYGKDTNTGEFINGEAGEVLIKPNPEFPVMFSFDKPEYRVGDIATVDYTINGLDEELADGKIWWSIWQTEPGDFSHPVIVEFEDSQTVSSISGRASITVPQIGKGIFLTVEGTTKEGKPIYAESDTALIYEVTQDMAQKLPETLTRIETEAFAGTGLRAIEIPVSVTYIDENAFDGTDIQLIIGSSEYVKEYAEKHHIRYIERNIINSALTE